MIFRIVPGISNGVYLPIGLFFFGQLVATGQVSQASAASISKPKAIVSPHSHCQPSVVWFVNTLLQNGHLSIQNYGSSGKSVG